MERLIVDGDVQIVPLQSRKLKSVMWLILTRHSLPCCQTEPGKTCRAGALLQSATEGLACKENHGFLKKSRLSLIRRNESGCGARRRNQNLTSWW